MNKISEKKIENGLARYYSSQNISVSRQVAFTQKRVDIVIKNKEQVWAIEVKVYDWKGALHQAMLNKIAFHQSYVAIWHKYSHRALNNRDRFESLGIGLIVIDSDYKPRIELSSCHSQHEALFNPLAHDYILEKI